MGGHRVILADSDANWRKNIKAILSKIGCLIIGEAADGVTAIKMVRDRQPDLVIIEATLPGMTGVEAATIVYEDKLAPVLLTTGHYRTHLLVQAKNAGVQSLLVKPFDESCLLPAVELALNNYAELVKLEQQLKKMEEKFESRKIIDRAKGILMESMSMSEEQAFKRMQKQSMNKRISMRAVAEAVVMAHNLQSDL